MPLFVAAAGALSGCEELEARRLIQRADALFLDGHPEESLPLYEEALAKKPDLAIGQHNAGIAYHKLFKEGDDSPKNLEIAKRATEHFQRYLALEPEDHEIQKLMTLTWEKSGQVDAALDFWKAKLDKDPGNLEIMNQLAAVNLNADRTEEGLSWFWKLADKEPEKAGKVKVYLSIGQTCAGRLARAELVDAERLALADEGIAAVQAAQALEPDNKRTEGLLQSIYTRRALAHGASWARLLDFAAARAHYARFRELDEALKAKNAAATGQKPVDGKSDAAKDDAKTAPAGSDEPERGTAR